MEELLENFNNIESFHWWWEGRREIIRRLINKNKIKKQLKILDIGCGTGETIKYLHRITPTSEIIGIDTSSLAVKLSKTNTSAKILEGSVLDLPFKKETFDLILLLDVLEHIKDDKKALNEAKRVLKKDGKIIVTCPATSLIWSRHDTRQGHERRYSMKEMKKLAESVSMKTDFINFYNFILFVPISIIRFLGKFKLLEFLSKYDNTINYSLANVSWVNNLLRKLILFEVNLMFRFRFPFGVSIVAYLKND